MRMRSFSSLIVASARSKRHAALGRLCALPEWASRDIVRTRYST